MLSRDIQPTEYLGSVEISLQLDNRELRKNTWAFVGVGSPNPLVNRLGNLDTTIGHPSYIVNPKNKQTLKVDSLLYHNLYED